MGRADIQVCPSCDYKRRLTEAETRIASSLVVACIKCGTPMQCNLMSDSTPARRNQSLPESCTPKALEEWMVF